ncbi:MAG: hypothetical protein ACE5HI_07990 [bacterium]
MSGKWDTKFKDFTEAYVHKSQPAEGDAPTARTTSKDSSRQTQTQTQTPDKATNKDE